MSDAFPTSFIIASDSADQTRSLGASLGVLIKQHRNSAPLIVFLSGDLGAGKTTFVSGFMRAFGVSGAIRSPTYTLLEPYDLGEHRIYHLDLYRLADPGELEMLGLRDLLDDDSVLLVEWPERGSSALPSPDLSLELAYYEGDVSRRILKVTGTSYTGRVLAAGLQQKSDKGSVST